MLRLLAVVAAVLLPVQACVLLLNGWQPKSLAQRARSADIVLTAYTRAAFKQHRSPVGDTYDAEFFILNVLKGEHILNGFRRPPVTEQRLINVTNFGEKTMCYADVNAGETYILFLTALNGQLSAKYDDIFGAAVLYSQEKEDEVLRALGWRPWGEWTSCSATCDGGIQQRKRLCNDSFSCSKDDGEQRTCNTFPCRDAVDLLEAVDLRRTSKLRGSDRPSAFTILPSTGWSVSAHSALPSSFPWEFSLFATVKLVPATEGYLTGVYLDSKLQLGLHVGERTSLVFSVADDVQVSFVTTMADGKWHQVAFSVSENLVTFYLDCREEGRLPLLEKIQPVHGDSVLVVGNLAKTKEEKPGEFDRFQGEVEQLVITPDHNNAKDQCSEHTQPLVVRPRGELPLMEEVKSGSHSINTHNARFPLRGDAVDDEDFSFSEDGSGFSQDDDDSEEGDSASEEESSEESDESSEEKKETSTKISKPLHIPSKAKVEDDESEGSGKSPKFELEWSEWSPCSSTCGWGRRKRTSYCIDNGLHLEECIEAGEERKETEVCFLQLCPTASHDVSTPVTPISDSAKCSNHCKNGGTCKSNSSCICPQGYEGLTCEKVSCRPGCLNGGFCTHPDVCKCLEGYTGQRCETAMCGSACLHGGQCVRPGLCLCRPGFSPPTCTAICQPSCRNGGVCVSANRCRCEPGFFGRFCEKAVCRQGCKNGGRCVATDKCACTSGYKGHDCGTPKCDPPCQNGGVCLKPYFCHCPAQTRGAFCEKYSCSKECLHGGHCVGPNKCSCPRGYRGRFCEEAFCPTGCFNGGKCKGGKCSCAAGFYGTACEFRRCNYTVVQEPYQRGYKQKVTTTELVPCGAWGWKQCTKTKVHYETIYKTFYRTTYKCAPEEKAKFWIKKG